MLACSRDFSKFVVVASCSASEMVLSLRAFAFPEAIEAIIPLSSSNFLDFRVSLGPQCHYDLVRMAVFYRQIHRLAPFLDMCPEVSLSFVFSFVRLSSTFFYPGTTMAPWD